MPGGAGAFVLAATQRRWGVCGVQIDGARGALALSAALLWSCTRSPLGWHFAVDHFALRYVWLYSSTALPLHLKIANLWGGDEGTTLLLVACCASLAASGARAGLDRWASLGGGCDRRRLAARSSGWPLAVTPADWLAQSPPQGMNAHLMKP